MRKRKYGVDIKQAAKELGISVNAIYARIKRNGWDIKDAVAVGYIPQKERIYNHHKTQKKKTVCKQAPRKVESCDGLQKSLSNLYGTIDKILQAKIAMRKLAKLPELANHFTGLSQSEKEYIDDACGGIKVNILNNPKENEFIYNIVGTDGKNLHTNDKAEFMAFMVEVA